MTGDTLEAYAHLSLEEMKEIGHRLMDEYVALEYRPWTDRQARDHAYENLYERLYKKRAHTTVWHFRNMSTRQEVASACKALKLMIVQRKKKRKYLASIGRLA